MRKIMIMILVGILVADFFTGFLSVGICKVADGDTITVDDSGGKDFVSIQDAIEAAVPGDTIMVYSGIYLGVSQVIHVYKQVFLQGVTENGGGKPTIGASVLINPVRIVGGEFVTSWGATDYCEVSNFKIVSNHSFYAALQIAYSEYVTISNCTISSPQKYGQGIKVAGSNYSAIQNCTVQNCGGTGIYFGSGNYNNIIVDNIICNNNKFGGWGGIAFWSFSNNNVIYRNKFINNSRWTNAFDQCNNTWYNPKSLVGNYWDDYTGNDNDSDGIGDTPYNISGKTPPSQDLYPLGYFKGEEEDEKEDEEQENYNISDNHTQDDSAAPGFEIVFMFIAILVVSLFFHKKYKIR